MRQLRDKANVVIPPYQSRHYHVMVRKAQGATIVVCHYAKWVI